MTRAEIPPAEQGPELLPDWKTGLVDTDPVATYIFNRVHELTPQQLRDFINARANGSADDMLFTLYETRLNGDRLTAWHEQQGHFEGEQAQLAYHAGLMYGVLMHEDLYATHRAGGLAPTGEDALTAYDVACSVLYHSYDEFPDQASHWQQERSRERYFSDGHDHFARAISLLSEWFNEWLGNERADEALYIGLVDAMIFLGAYIRWKDDGLPPERHEAVPDEASVANHYPTFAPGDVDASELIALLTPHLPSRFTLHTPAGHIGSVDEEWPHIRYEWFGLGSAEDAASHPNATNPPKPKYFALVISQPRQVGMHHFDWIHHIVFAARTGDESAPTQLDDTAERVLQDGRLLPDLGHSQRMFATRALRYAMQRAEGGYDPTPHITATYLGLVGVLVRHNEPWAIPADRAEAA